MAPKTIDEYLGDFSGDVKKKLIKVRAIVKKHAPQAEEAIAYGIPKGDREVLFSRVITGQADCRDSEIQSQRKYGQGMRLI